MFLVAEQPERSREEILAAEDPEELLEGRYDESDLRRDWYLANLEEGPEYDFFQQEGVTGIEFEEGGKDYRIVGIAHGAKEGILSPDEGLKETVRDYVRSISEDRDFFYEQNFDRVFDVDGIEMDDLSWAVDEADRIGFDFADRRVEKLAKKQSNVHWAKTLAKVASYYLASRSEQEEVLVGNSELLRDGEQLTNMIAALENPSPDLLRDLQRNIYRSNLPEPLSRELSEGRYEELLESGRSERMADFVRSRSEKDKVTMLVGGSHMFHIPYYLRNNPQNQIEVSDTDIDKWQEEELKPRLEEKT